MAADDEMSHDALKEELRVLRAELEKLRCGEALRRSEANLRNAQRIAHLGSWDWNLETGELDWSDENYRIFRLEPGSPMDYQRFLGFIHPDDRETLQQLVAQAFQSRRSFQFDYRIVLPDGGVRHLACQGEVEWRDDSPIRFCGTSQDRTEQFQIEATLADYRDHLERLVEERSVALQVSQQKLREADRLSSLGTLAAGLAHQINNPIAVILLAVRYARLRIDDEDSRGVLEKVIDDIAREAERCGRIVDSVLQLARGESPEQWREDLNASVQRACLLSSPHAAERHATLELELREPNLPVVMNPVDLEQALVNLLRNAIESKPLGACVRVTAEQAEPLQSGGAPRARVRVSDDGRGLDASEQKRIFDPFYTTRLADGGTGLGLSIAREIVRRHRGDLSVVSVPGSGATFCVDLPIAVAGAAAEPSESNR